MKVGILALQGCIDPHVRLLTPLGVECIKVRDAKDLEGISRLIMPGGESTTHLRLLKKHNLFDPLIAFAKKRPVWGICAGAILAAREVEPTGQESLGIIDIKAYRNYYGCQLYSFNASIEIIPLSKQMAVQFIRAPMLVPLSENVKVLATYQSKPVFLEQGNVMITAFHVELGTDPALHKYFLELG